MSKNAHLKKKKCDMCDNLIKANDALARDKENPLNKFCVTCFKEATKQTSVSNELETNTNSEMAMKMKSSRQQKKWSCNIEKNVQEETI